MEQRAFSTLATNRAIYNAPMVRPWRDVLLQLSQATDQETGWTHELFSPSVPTIHRRVCGGDRTGRATRMVIRCLEDLGLIEVKRRRKGRVNLPNLYRVCVDTLAQWEAKGREWLEKFVNWKSDQKTAWKDKEGWHRTISETTHRAWAWATDLLDRWDVLTGKPEEAPTVELPKKDAHEELAEEDEDLDDSGDEEPDEEDEDLDEDADGARPHEGGLDEEAPIEEVPEEPAPMKKPRVAAEQKLSNEQLEELIKAWAPPAVAPFCGHLRKPILKLWKTLKYPAAPEFLAVVKKVAAAPTCNWRRDLVAHRFAELLAAVPQAPASSDEPDIPRSAWDSIVPATAPEPAASELRQALRTAAARPGVEGVLEARAEMQKFVKAAWAALPDSERQPLLDAQRAIYGALSFCNDAMVADMAIREWGHETFPMLTISRFD